MNPVASRAPEVPPETPDSFEWENRYAQARFAYVHDVAPGSDPDSMAWHSTSIPQTGRRCARSLWGRRVVADGGHPCPTWRIPDARPQRDQAGSAERVSRTDGSACRWSWRSRDARASPLDQRLKYTGAQIPVATVGKQSHDCPTGNRAGQLQRSGNGGPARHPHEQTFA